MHSMNKYLLRACYELDIYCARSWGLIVSNTDTIPTLLSCWSRIGRKSTNVCNSVKRPRTYILPSKTDLNSLFSIGGIQSIIKVC